MTNKGKKYKRLTGEEIATPQDTAEGANFMQWYGNNYDRLRCELRKSGIFEDEVFIKTALKIYDAILYKGLWLDTYEWYFFSAYKTNRLAESTERHKHDERVLPLVNSWFDYEEVADVKEAPELPDAMYIEVMEYVRVKYNARHAAVFEIYIANPKITPSSLAALCAMPQSTIAAILIRIKKDLRAQFGKKFVYLLS